MAVRGSFCIDDKLLPFFCALACDGAEHLLREPLHRPVWTERDAKKVSDGLTGIHDGIDPRSGAATDSALIASRPRFR